MAKYVNEYDWEHDVVDHPETKKACHRYRVWDRKTGKLLETKYFPGYLK
ncbi:MAG: hypothetical protein MJZ34_04690 [Paludibacteraceae bacterium]|nr:hypothetical protein [Paludibacteraceae bacterium]